MYKYRAISLDQFLCCERLTYTQVNTVGLGGFSRAQWLRLRRPQIKLNHNKSNQMKYWFYGERGKPEHHGKNLSEQSREPINLVHRRRAGRMSTLTTEPTLGSIELFDVIMLESVTHGVQY